MLVVRLDTGFNIEVEFPIAPFHRRLFAWITDFLILLSYLWVVNVILKSMLGDFWIVEYEWVYILYLLPYLLYHLLMEIILNGQSLGKKVMRIKVITMEGGQPTISQYLVRWMFRLIDIGLFFLPGFFSVILSARSQRIGDHIAGTIIIDTRASTSWQDTIFTEIESSYKPKYPQVMQLSDKDINTLKSIIGVVRKRADHELAHRIADRIQSRLSMQSEEESSIAFLERLLKDYNYYSTKA
jgi:uncharacterized RDD family membrane protein YckC